MKQTYALLLLAASLSPAFATAQVGGATVAPIAAPAAVNGTNPTVISTGVDTRTNQVYMIWDQPVRKSINGNVIDGITLWVNDVQRAIAGGGGTHGSTGIETSVTPIGIEIQPTDRVKIAYSPSTNPIVSSTSGLRALVVPITTVTNGLAGDTECPNLQTRLIKTDSKKNIFIAYMSEHVTQGDTSFGEYGQGNNIMIGSTPITSDITITLGSSIATKIITPSALDWTQPIAITIDETTNLVDTTGNKACAGAVTLSATGASKPRGVAAVNNTQVSPTTTVTPAVTQPAAAPVQPITTTTPVTTIQPVAIAPVVTTPEQATTTPEITELATPTTPTITTITTVEPTGQYAPGKTLTLEAIANTKLDSTSYILLELNTGGKKVALRPTADGVMTLRGTFIITQNMLSNTQLKVSKAISVKLVDDSDSKKVTTSVTLPIFDAAAPEYAKNIGDKVITITTTTN